MPCNHHSLHRCRRESDSTVGPSRLRVLSLLHPLGAGTVYMLRDIPRMDRCDAPNPRFKIALESMHVAVAPLLVLPAESMPIATRQLKLYDSEPSEQGAAAAAAPQPDRVGWGTYTYLCRVSHSPLISLDHLGHARPEPVTSVEPLALTSA
jgi:hypothetical protein